MKIPFVHNKPVIFVAIGLIVVSTAALSFVSYHYTVRRENAVETTLEQNTVRQVLHYVDLIEEKLLDNDRILSEKIVNVDDPANWPAMVDAIKKADLNVDQVYFLRPNGKKTLYPPYSYEIRNQWGRFHAILKEIDLDNLPLNQPHHLHKERPDNYFFMTYVLRETMDGSRILVCYQLNFDSIIALLDRHLRDLRDRFYVSIVDFENNGVYGQPISRSSKYFFETRFPTTLYKWILQMVPRNYTELEQGIKNQRRTNLFFIVLSMSTIFFSLAIIYGAWQRDRQLRQLKENFISNVSHELKTPLSLIRMFSEILVTGRVRNEDKKQEYYRIIHSESDRMSRLINNLLDFANLVRGIEQKHFEKINLAQVVTKALEAYRYEIQKDGFLLTLGVSPDIPDSYADPNAITMAFFNLLDNSVKYSPDQKQIEVQVGRKDGFLDIAVRDRGIGIPLSEQQKIFDQFYRGSDASVRRIRGSGIGLAITRRVAKMHGGEVLVESAPGKGSTFTLRIPIINDSKFEIRDSKFKDLDSQASNSEPGNGSAALGKA
jgi:two-component system, OmpR family, phosphate regulon sensor histidine kinase PhoR